MILSNMSPPFCRGDSEVTLENVEVGIFVLSSKNWSFGF